MVAIQDYVAAGGRIRPLTSADIARVRELEPQIFGHEAWADALLTQELIAPYRSYWVLEVAERVEGYAGLVLAGEAADVQTIAVSAEMRGRGWGKALLAQLVDFAAAEGAKQIFLEVRVDNLVAIKMYEKHGFRQISVRRGYYAAADGGRVDGAVMCAQLPVSAAAKD